MGFGFRGQSDNAAVIRAGLEYGQGQPLTPETRAQVTQILRNEIKARTIEYATLVGPDLKIIANANANRTGERFDPNDLVTTVLDDPKQIKASAIVSWADLQQERPPLPEGFAEKDALIRYTATPVLAPGTARVIGVLISGDIVNDKLPIVEGTLDAFETGYSAVYLRQPDGAFQLATALEQDEVDGPRESNQAISDPMLLAAAAAAEPNPVTERVRGNDGTTYTMAAQAIPNIEGDPVAILVRGIPESGLNARLSQNLGFQMLIALVALAADILLAGLLSKAISKPIQTLQKTTQRFAEGDHRARAEIFAADEVGQLANAFNSLADSIITSEVNLLKQVQTQETNADQSRSLMGLTARMRESLDREQIFNTCVHETRAILSADRTIVYLFNEDWQGTVVSESVGPGWPVVLGANIADPCFAQAYAQKYQQGRIQATANIEAANLSECHLNQLRPFQVKANLVAPIVVEGKLLGLLVTHQCSAPRNWQEAEITFVRQIAIQLGFALEQAQLFGQREQARLRAEATSEEQRQLKEELQLQLINLLGHVEGAATGDLTVRAEVSTGEIGTVADFFNSIIESLRQIVTQVQHSATQVNSAIGDNEIAIRQLADTAFYQAEEITRTLDSVEQMTSSIQVVATSAHQAADVARTASDTAQAGGAAMDLTAQKILSLRETVAATAKKVKRLGESSQQISKVVSLINQIALQTNLLAINAGIEAARAGEEGQGFAVVAEEVGQLAARSAAATREIENIVDTIQSETSQVVEAMEESTAQVVEGTHLVDATKQSLEQILQVSAQIDQLVQSISTATVSQVETSEVVSGLMQEIAQASEQTSKSSHQVSSSLNQTIQIAQELQESVGAFKVNSEDT
ncbi:MAG: GAF domain-containing protein [Cyanothece sp. SIO1E1]|nr:GAF domain-containing protein [Cyanothece sp. SIO1E1]